LFQTTFCVTEATVVDHTHSKKRKSEEETEVKEVAVNNGEACLTFPKEITMVLKLLTTQKSIYEKLFRFTKNKSLKRIKITFFYKQPK
jgi:hypothetical protein